MLEIGERLYCEETGQWVTVEAVVETSEMTTVYNFEVEDYHTYFVSDDGWGFAVWAHNYSEKFKKGFGAKERADTRKAQDVPGSGKARARLQTYVARRNKAMREGRTGDANRATEGLGRRAARELMGDDPVYQSSRKRGGKDDVDLVFKVGNRYIVVEAKGGDSPLKGRTLKYGPNKGQRAQQGSEAYLRDILTDMQQPGRPKRTRQMGRDLEAALNAGRLTYAKTHIPITRLGDGVGKLGTRMTYVEFDI
jgi:hypothetical protein